MGAPASASAPLCAALALQNAAALVVDIRGIRKEWKVLGVVRGLFPKYYKVQGEPLV